MRIFIGEKEVVVTIGSKMSELTVCFKRRFGFGIPKICR